MGCVYILSSLLSCGWDRPKTWILFLEKNIPPKEKQMLYAIRLTDMHFFPSKKLAQDFRGICGEGLAEI